MSEAEKRKRKEREERKGTESKGGMGECWRGRGIVIGKKGKREVKNKSEVGSGKRERYVSCWTGTKISRQDRIYEKLL